MNFTATFCDTNEISSNDIDRNPFGKKSNHNYSVIRSHFDTNIIYRDPFGQIKCQKMNLIGTLLDTNKISAKDIDMDPFGNKLNHNYSVINETSMNDIDIYPFLNKLNHNH